MVVELGASPTDSIVNVERAPPRAEGLLGPPTRGQRHSMQVVIEGLALAAFNNIRETAQNPLAQQVNAYVMQDESRHVAFGRHPLRHERRGEEGQVVEGLLG